jgi:hypothetical protein
VDRIPLVEKPRFRGSLNVFISSRTDSMINEIPYGKIAKENKDEDLTEDELIDKIIAKLRPQIKEIVANKEAVASNSVLTAPRYQSNKEMKRKFDLVSPGSQTQSDSRAA